jgi:hypothetical protein
MKVLAWSCAAVLCLFFPALSRGQNTGRIECARNDGYVYLYSSMTTLDVRATLPCGAIVQITGRYEAYFGVISAKGDPGFVPLASVVLLKDAPGSSPAMPAAPVRERMHYDEQQRQPVSPHANVVPFTLAKDTPARVKLTKALSSATAHAGDAVEFEVLDDIFVEGVLVLHKGTKVSGVVAEAEVKKRFGRGGKLAVSLTTLKLADGEVVPIRCYLEVSGDSNNSADAVVPLASGKDAAMLQGSEYTALVDGDVHLKREGFSVESKDVSAGAPTTAAAPNAPPQR